MATPRIFISYRKTDSSDWTGRIAGDLTKRFGKQHVFIDFDTLVPGQDYANSIEQRLNSVDVLLAVIGPNWLATTDVNGLRRLEQSEDLLRAEIATALRRGIRVVPVLVGKALMPTAVELPEEIQSLTRRHAFEVSDTRWDYDLNRLSDSLAESGSLSSEDSSLISNRRRRTMATSFAVLAAAIIGGYLAITSISGSNHSLDRSEATIGPSDDVYAGAVTSIRNSEGNPRTIRTDKVVYSTPTSLQTTGDVLQSGDVVYVLNSGRVDWFNDSEGFGFRLKVKYRKSSGDFATGYIDGGYSAVK